MNLFVLTVAPGKPNFGTPCCTNRSSEVDLLHRRYDYGAGLARRRTHQGNVVEEEASRAGAGGVDSVG